MCTRRGIALREYPTLLRLERRTLTMTDRYFCNPDFDQFIEALPGTYEKVEDKKYPGVTSGEYLVQRLEATY